MNLIQFEQDGWRNLGKGAHKAVLSRIATHKELGFDVQHIEFPQHFWGGEPYRAYDVVEFNDMLALWCKANCGGSFRINKNYLVAFFEDDADALLFHLTWCGPFVG